MDYFYWLSYIYERKIGIGVQCVLTILTYLLVKYRYKQPSSYLVLKKSAKENLIKIYQPKPLIETGVVPYVFKKVKYNFSNHDVFNFGRRFKNEIKETIAEYGVGTCGPRGFYGTLDLHLDLERKLATIFDKEAAIIFSNYFTGLQSIIACFCKSRFNIFVHTDASEIIQSGIYLSGATKHMYETLEDLENKLKPKRSDKFLIIERVGKNIGKLIDLGEIVRLKKKYGFRIILDEAYSVPFIYQNPKEYELYSEMDFITGSLSLGYPTNGGFCICSKECLDYQMLSVPAYVFSASLPAFLTKAALCMLSERIDYTKIRDLVRKAHELLPGIVSPEDTPIVLISCEKVDQVHEKLREEGFVVGLCGKYLRLCINEECNVDHLKAVGKIIKNFS